MLSLPLAGRYLERVWGQAEFLKFVVVVLVASNAIAVLVNYIESIILPGGAETFL
jgi:membrane associated rhomboid family serine protease